MPSDNSLILRPLTLQDEPIFLTAMQRSLPLYNAWMKAPLTHEDFMELYQRYSLPNQRSFLLCNQTDSIVGVFNLSEIVRGPFQNAYLGFSVIIDYAGQGYMSLGLKLLLEKAFTELELHRVEANIQPTNLRSINLVCKNAFRKEGLSLRYLNVNGEWRDFERWAITHEDWLAHKHL